MRGRWKGPKMKRNKRKGYPPLAEYHAISVKAEVDIAEDFRHMKPALFFLFGAFLEYALHYELPVTVTSISDKAKNRVSRTHQEFRAIDISARGWSDFHAERITYHLNRKFKDVAAISASDHVPRAVILHDAGSGRHFHLQVRPGYPRFFWTDDEN